MPINTSLIRSDEITDDCRIDTVCGAKTEVFLPTELFASVVAHTPLIAIDLIVTDPQGAVLLGLRNNAPAQGFWFVPGGRIRKNESINVAFMRITENELGCAMQIAQSRFIGIFEHFYDVDFSGATGAGTHYVVLAYRLQIEHRLRTLPRQQHSQYIWLQPDQALQQPLVHPYTQAYFESIPK